jgi:hypothetical protein
MNQEEFQHNINTLSNAEERQLTKPWFTEGIIIAAIPLVAYGLTFAYEYGYATFFDIPIEVINLTLTNVLMLCLIWLMIMVTVFQLSNIVYQIWPKGQKVHPIYLKLQKHIPVWIVVISFLSIYGTTLKEWVIGVGIILTLIGLDFLRVIIHHQDKQGFREKLIADLNTPEPEGILDFLDRRIGASIVTIMIVLFFSFMISIFVGNFEARKKTKFLVINQTQELVVLRTYGDKLICAPFYRTTKEVKRTFIILKMAENPSLTLNPEKVGPLHIEK